MKPQTIGLVKGICLYFAVLCLIAAIGVDTCVATEEIDIIVGFSTGVDISTILPESNHSEVNHEYDIINAVAMTVNVSELNQLNNNSAVAYIEEDILVHVAHEKLYSIDRSSEETLEWNIERIGADRVWGYGGIPEIIVGYNTGAGVDIAIIDTGASRYHPDLSNNLAGGISFVSPDPDNWDDLHGHGSHVAGIIAAVDNDIGVIGVAPESSIHPVQAFNMQGTARLSDILQGIQWCVENDMDIISMSFSGNSGSYSLKLALQAAYDNGIVLVSSAGNTKSSVTIPASFDTVIAVSATTDSDEIAEYSSWGNEIDIAAPGTRIYSLYKGDGYTGASGTSCACPHITGIVALILNTEIPEIYDLNQNDQWDPSEVRLRLSDTAEDLGAEGWDQYYGHGLADAYRATQEGTDWNPWDDDCAISNIEISMAEWYWASTTPINRHLITNTEILLLEYQWVSGDAC